MKKLSEQTIVITGASSGIGLATARLAAEAGARVVLTSRNEAELSRITDEIRANGGQATYAVADVADLEALRGVAREAIRAFGSIDTWVNNAGLSVYGRAREVPIADQRRVVDVNLWGTVYGTLVALDYLAQTGGTIIQVGSVESERAVPLHASYAAAKHGLKAWTDSLRMELEHDKVPVALTLIEPGSIDTPFPEHSRSYMGAEPQLPPPIYAPEVVAKAILECAEKPRRKVVVGGAGRTMTWMEKAVPRLGDKYMERSFFQEQRKERAPTPEDSLYSPPRREGEARGHNRPRVHEHSAWTWAALHPTTTALAAAAIVGSWALGTKRVTSSRRPSRASGYERAPRAYTRAPDLSTQQPSGGYAPNAGERPETATFGRPTSETPGTINREPQVRGGGYGEPTRIPPEPGTTPRRWD